MINSKKFLIMGMGKTGKTAYDSLKHRYDLICYDDNKLIKDQLKISYVFIENIDKINWSEISNLLVSPGIDLCHPLIKQAKDNDIKIVGDLDLFYEANKDSNIIGITGTNGKSTTTALIHHIIKAANLDYEIGGNIGIGIMSLPNNKQGYIIELSSYALELKNEFTPNIAIILNITPDHLDRHKTLDNYIEAKLKILQNLKGYLILSLDSPINEEIYEKLKILKKEYKVITISGYKQADVKVDNSFLYDNFLKYISVKYQSNKYLKGAHNQENIAASYITCQLLGIDIKIIIKAIKTYIGLPHRMQYLGQIGQRIFYNDSKATNSIAASKSIQSLDNIYWLAGGIAKQGGIDDIVLLLANIKKAYLFGQDQLLLAETLKKNNINYSLYANLEEAFSAAFDEASIETSQCNILLAPACASYDQFDNFEARGEHFIELFKQKLYESKSIK